MNDIAAPLLIAAVVLALCAGVLLAFGTHLQSMAVAQRHRSAESHRPALVVVADRRWLAGGAALVSSIVIQLWSVSLAPVSVVQPLGVSALVISALIRSRSQDKTQHWSLIRDVMFCVVGVTIFVAISTRFSSERAVGDGDAVRLLVAVLVIAGSAIVCAVIFRGRVRRAVLIAGAGLSFGAVVTLAKVLLSQIPLWTSGRTSTALSPPVVVACSLVFAGAAAVGSIVVQISHRTSTSEFVIGSLTVVDPLTAVLLGGVFLGEMAAFPTWAAIPMVCAGALAIAGVVGLSRGQRLNGEGTAEVAEPMATE